jgi:hypothetical protein
MKNQNKFKILIKFGFFIKCSCHIFLPHSQRIFEGARNATVEVESGSLPQAAA